jgi:hypothetical protein
LYLQVGRRGLIVAGGLAINPELNGGINRISDGGD